MQVRGCKMFENEFLKLILITKMYYSKGGFCGNWSNFVTGEEEEKKKDEQNRNFHVWFS